MKFDKAFEAPIDPDFALMEQARAARLKYVRELLKSAHSATARGIHGAISSVDKSLSRQDEGATPENS